MTRILEQIYITHALLGSDFLNKSTLKLHTVNLGIISYVYLFLRRLFDHHLVLGHPCTLYKQYRPQ